LKAKTKKSETKPITRRAFDGCKSMGAKRKVFAAKRQWLLEGGMRTAR
jgi:hypothetical protein